MNNTKVLWILYGSERTVKNEIVLNIERLLNRTMSKIKPTGLSKYEMTR